MPLLSDEPHTPATLPMARFRLKWFFPFIPLLMGMVAGFACARVAGASLGLFLGGVFFAAMLTPPTALAVPTLPRRGINVVAIVIGIGVMWIFYGVHEEGTTLVQCINCIVVLASFAICIGAFAAMLEALRFNPYIASALTVFLALAWLTWPIWLAPKLVTPAGDAIVRWLVPAHPLLTINGLLPDIGNWNEQRIAYHLTNLGNDVPYEKPASARTTAIVHLGLSGIFLLAAWLRRKSEALDQSLLGHSDIGY